jgi:4-amino-4-deoxy-L-arabinose transferase-like glycosyltransferase
VFFLFVAGFLSGLMFLTKFTGGIFFGGLLLFLLYKRKFKASVLFALIFILVSLVFVFSHLGVPVEQVSVGGYGKLVSDNLLINFYSNIIRVFEIFLWLFSNNFYPFFIPFLLVFGLFLKRRREEVFFSFLLLSSLVFFLTVFINGAFPSFTGFPRYFLPIYSILCIFSGIQLEKLFFLTKNIFRIFLYVFFSLSFLYIAFLFVSYSTHQLDSPDSGLMFASLENSPEVSVWFVNGAARVWELNKCRLYDYSWNADFSGDPCNFLKKHRINYVVYYHNSPLGDNPDYLMDFGSQLRESLMEQNCSILLDSGASVKTISFKIE